MKASSRTRRVRGLPPALGAGREGGRHQQGGTDQPQTIPGGAPDQGAEGCGFLDPAGHGGLGVLESLQQVLTQHGHRFGQVRLREGGTLHGSELPLQGEGIGGRADDGGEVNELIADRAPLNGLESGTVGEGPHREITLKGDQKQIEEGDEHRPAPEPLAQQKELLAIRLDMGCQMHQQEAHDGKAGIGDHQLDETLLPLGLQELNRETARHHGEGEEAVQGHGSGQKH